MKCKKIEENLKVNRFCKRENYPINLLGSAVKPGNICVLNFEFADLDESLR